MNEGLRSGERQVAETLEGIEQWHKWRYNEALKYVEGKKIIDLGNGCGYGSFILSEKAKAVVAVDDCEEAIEFAKKHYEAKNITYKVEDVMKVKGKYDVVVAFEIIEHIESFVDVWNKLEKLVKGGGRIILSVPHTSIPVTISRWHYRHYQKGEVKRFLEYRNFEIERLEMPKFQNGLAVFCVAKKKK